MYRQAVQKRAMRPLRIQPLSEHTVKNRLAFPHQHGKSDTSKSILHSFHYEVIILEQTCMIMMLLKNAFWKWNSLLNLALFVDETWTTFSSFFHLLYPVFHLSFFSAVSFYSCNECIRFPIYIVKFVLLAQLEADSRKYKIKTRLVCQKGGLSGVMLLSLAVCWADTVSVTWGERGQGMSKKRPPTACFCTLGLYSYSGPCAKSDRPSICVWVF